MTIAVLIIVSPLFIIAGLYCYKVFLELKAEIAFIKELADTAGRKGK